MPEPTCLIKLYGNLREAAGGAEIRTTANTLRAALHKACIKHPELSPMIFEGNQKQKYVRLLVNGRDIELGQGLETPLKNGDQIAIFPPLAGG